VRHNQATTAMPAGIASQRLVCHSLLVTNEQLYLSHPRLTRTNAHAHPVQLLRLQRLMLKEVRELLRL
jgi:hypothetical protein